MTIPPSQNRPILESNLTMTDEFRGWAGDVTRALPIIGTGSPEGVVTALQFQVYRDSAASTGSITYIKMQPDIAGDKSKGWFLE